MDNSLSIINTELLSETEKTEVDREINQLISRHKNNRYEINRLVFESVAALTDSQNYTDELHSQGIVKRFWGGITGKNQELRDRAANSLARAQYASQQTLQKLAEQNIMSFELITAVNNKLNASLIEVESEINKIYATLTVFFKRTKSDIIQLESRVERLERNVNLLNWQSSIEFQMWDGIEYSELNTTDKIVCLIRDFYELTKGAWTTSDLLLLKSAMAEIGLSPKDAITYRYFIETICKNEKSFEKLFGAEDITGVERIPEYVALTAGIRKNRGLVSEEQYVLDNTCKVLDTFQCEYQKEEVRYHLLAEYEKEQAKINIDTSVNMYDFMLELLYNLQQIKEMKKVNSFSDKLKEAELLFGIWDIEHAYPILKELAEYGVTRARYMLGVIANVNFNYCEKDQYRWKKILQECIEEEPLARVRYYLPVYFNVDYTEEEEEAVRSAINMLKKQAETGDRLAAWEYGRSCLNLSFFGMGENDCQEAIRMFNKTYPVLGKFNIAWRYATGDGVEKDAKQAHNYYLEAAKYGNGQAEYEVGRDYENGWGCEKDVKKAFEYYKRAEEHGCWDAINGIACCYSDGKGVETNDKVAFDYYMKGAELNLVKPTSNVGWSYEYGKGVNQDYTQARKYYQKAIPLGDDGYARTNLALLYIQGKGGDVNKNEAKKLLEEAAEMGYERAKKELKENFK